MEVWIGRDGERHGPYKEVDIRQWLRSGEISPDDLGWYEGMTDWAPLSSLFPEELKNQNAAPAAPPLPPVPSSFPETAPLTVAVVDYASFWQRFGAWVIDLVVLMIPCSIVSYAMGGLTAFEHLLPQLQGSPEVMTKAMIDYALATRSINIAITVIGFLYYTLFEASRWQATPGKLVLRLRVTDMNGKKLSIARASLRNVVRLANLITGLIPFVCYITVAWTQRKQGLHDLAAHALVLNGTADAAESSTPVESRDSSFNA